MKEPTLEDFAEARKMMGSMGEGEGWAPGGYAEEDENGVVTVYDGKGVPRAMMSRAAYEKLVTG